MHHFNTCARHSIPANAGATTSPSTREVYTSTASAPRTPAVAPTCTQRLPSTLSENSSRRLIAYKSLATTSIINPDDHKLHRFYDRRRGESWRSALAVILGDTVHMRLVYSCTDSPGSSTKRLKTPTTCAMSWHVASGGVPQSARGKGRTSLPTPPEEYLSTFEKRLSCFRPWASGRDYNPSSQAAQESTRYIQAATSWLSGTRGPC